MDAILDTILRQLNYISDKVDNLESNMNRKFQEQDEKIERRFQEQKEEWKNIFQKHKIEIENKLDIFSKEVSTELSDVLDAVNRRNDRKFDEIVELVKQNQAMLQNHEKRIGNLEKNQRRSIAIL